MVAADNYERVFRGLDSGGDYRVSISDSVATNPDGTEMLLYNCEYSIGPLKSRFMVKKGTKHRPISEKQYQYLVSLNNQVNVVSIENFFKDEMDIGCLVIEPIHMSFHCWLRKLRNQPTNEPITDGRMSPTLRSIILKLCSLLSHILEQGWYPQKLSVNDLYIKLDGSGEPTLKSSAN